MILLRLVAAALLLAYLSADAGESAERPYQLVTVYERHGRHVKRSTQSPLPRDLHVEFKLDKTPVEFHLRRNARVHRKIPVTFEGDNRTLFVTIDENVSAYQDVKFGAALMVTAFDKDSGGIHSHRRTVEGSFFANGTHYTIRPESAEPLPSGGHTHRVEKVPASKNYGGAVGRDYLEIADTVNVNISAVEGNDHRRTKRDTLTEYFDYHVELQFIMDYTVWSFYMEKANDNKAAALSSLNYYFTHIYNGMDMAYKSIDEKTWGFAISIFLVGYHIADKNETSWWTENNVINRKPAIRDTVVDGTSILKDIGKWSTNASEGRSWHHPDHTMLFTRYNLFGSSLSTVGYAYSKGICRPTVAASVIEIDTLLNVWSISAHELGHKCYPRWCG